LCNGKQRTGDTDITTTETSFTDMTDMEINFYSSGGDVVFDTFATLEGVAIISLVIDVDGTDYALQANRQAGGGADDNFWLGTKASVPLTQGEHTVKTQWKVVSGTGEQPGSSDGRRLLSFQEM